MGTGERTCVPSQLGVCFLGGYPKPPSSQIQSQMFIPKCVEYVIQRWLFVLVCYTSRLFTLDRSQLQRNFWFCSNCIWFWVLTPVRGVPSLVVLFSLWSSNAGTTYSWISNNLKNSIYIYITFIIRERLSCQVLKSKFLKLHVCFQDIVCVLLSSLCSYYQWWVKFAIVAQKILSDPECCIWLVDWWQILSYMIGPLGHFGLHCLG